MEIPVLPLALGAIALTFAVAVLGWWVASRVERRRKLRSTPAPRRRPRRE